MYVSVVFVRRCLYSAVSLTLVREQRFIRIIYYQQLKPVQSFAHRSLLVGHMCIIMCPCGRSLFNSQSLFRAKHRFWPSPRAAVLLLEISSRRRVPRMKAHCSAQLFGPRNLESAPAVVDNCYVFCQLRGSDSGSGLV